MRVGDWDCEQRRAGAASVVIGGDWENMFLNILRAFACDHSFVKCCSGLMHSTLGPVHSTMGPQPVAGSDLIVEC